MSPAKEHKIICWDFDAPDVTPSYLIIRRGRALAWLSLKEFPQLSPPQCLGSREETKGKLSSSSGSKARSLNHSLLGEMLKAGGEMLAHKTIQQDDLEFPLVPPTPCVQL